MNAAPAEKSYGMAPKSWFKRGDALTIRSSQGSALSVPTSIRREVEDKDGQDGDQDAGDDDVDEVEEGLAPDDEVERDVLVQRVSWEGVLAGRLVPDFPLPIFCRNKGWKESAKGALGIEHWLLFLSHHFAGITETGATEIASSSASCRAPGHSLSAGRSTF